jgi:putative membrane protein
MVKLIFQAIAGTLGLWLAVKFVPGVEFVGEIKYLIIAGVVLGLINFFIKPLLKILTLPLRVLTLGLFSLIINMAIIWAVDVIFPELIIQGLIPLFWTTLIVWAISIFLGFYPSK